MMLQITIKGEYYEKEEVIIQDDIVEDKEKFLQDEREHIEVSSNQRNDLNEKIR